MSVESTMAIAGAAVSGAVALLYVGKRAMEAVAALVLALVPVIGALGKVRAAWRESFGPNASELPAVDPVLEGGDGRDDHGSDLD